MSDNQEPAEAPSQEQPPATPEDAAQEATGGPSSGQPHCVSSPVLLNHLHKAKALSERLLAVMAQREERLAEIKRRVSLLEQGEESIQPLVEAENNMKEAHNRMKTVLADLGKELDLAGVTDLPSDSSFLADTPAAPTGQVDEVAVLYKQLLLALGEWKAAQQKVATNRAEELAKQVQSLRDQVNREQAETRRIRQRREELERMRTEKQEELDALSRQSDGMNGHQS